MPSRKLSNDGVVVYSVERTHRVPIRLEEQFIWATTKSVFTVSISVVILQFTRKIF